MSIGSFWPNRISHQLLIYIKLKVYIYVKCNVNHDMSFYGQFLEIGIFSQKWQLAENLVWGNLGRFGATWFDYLEYPDEKCLNF